MKKSIVTLMTVTAVMLGATAALAAPPKADLNKQLAELRAATAQFHRVDAALDAGYESFRLEPSNTEGLGLPGDPTCFDSDEFGGMGVHYVKGIDETVNPNEPEAMVYEIAPNGNLRLVAVEYIVPVTVANEDNPPTLFGHTFHKNAALGVHVLHVWVWKHNPSGMFKDFNPKVGACPSN